MSESTEKRRRYNLKVEFADALAQWQRCEPHKWRIILWHRWLKSMPKKEDFGL